MPGTDSAIAAYHVSRFALPEITLALAISAAALTAASAAADLSGPADAPRW